MFCSDAKIAEALVLSVLKQVGDDDIFPELTEHMVEQTVTDNHLFLLIKSVSRSYIKIRMHHVAKEANEALLKNDKVRKKMSKLILFKHQ